jgi:hypothetical protein
MLVLEYEVVLLVLYLENPGSLDMSIPGTYKVGGSCYVGRVCPSVLCAEVNQASNRRTYLSRVQFLNYDYVSSMSY